jgi:predicted metal-dependent hydrolase
MQQFDPFNDRLARDIRNGLSHALIKGLDQSNPNLVHDVATGFFGRNLAPRYTEYIQARLRHYDAIFAETEKDGEADIFSQALLLWDRGLYFEVHDRLETIWLKATGTRRMALQGMIRAAGAYIKWQSGQPEAARKMAAKAAAALIEHHAALPQQIQNIDVLIRVLQDPIEELPHIPLRAAPLSERKPR